MSVIAAPGDVWVSKEQRTAAPKLPATVIVDRQGRVAARITGVTDGAQLRELLDRILSEQAASESTGGR